MLAARDRTGDIVHAELLDEEEQHRIEGFFRLRFKHYTDFRGRDKLKNGKSPLEVCGVMLKSKDWLKNSLYFNFINHFQVRFPF